MLKKKVPDSIPNGWTKIEKTFYDRDIADLNRGKGGREIFLFYKREPNKPAITRLTLHWKIAETIPPYFTLLQYTISGSFLANLNTGAGNPEIYICYKKETDEELFLQSELGWDPRNGFQKQNMSNEWIKYFHDISITDSDIIGESELVRFSVEETVSKYHDIFEQKNSRNLSCCFNCNRQFHYPNETNKVYCPFCQTINTCSWINNRNPTTTTSNVDSSSKSRPLSSSCDPRILGNNNNSPVKNPSFDRASSFVPGYLPSSSSNQIVPPAYSNAFQPPPKNENLPAYATQFGTSNPVNPSAPLQSNLPAYLSNLQVTTVAQPSLPPMDPFHLIPLGTVPVR